MNTLIDLEKKINSELTTKIDQSKILHNQLYIEIDKEDLIDVILFLKTNNNTKFRQLIDITYLGSGIWSYTFRKAGAILFVSVPATIITSDCLGEPRGAAPNLSKSYLGIAV